MLRPAVITAALVCECLLNPTLGQWGNEAAAPPVVARVASDDRPLLVPEGDGYRLELAPLERLIEEYADHVRAVDRVVSARWRT